MLTETLIDTLGKKIWDYGLMHHQLEKSDAIMVFGSYNPAVGLRAAELFAQGWAPIIVISGNRSDATSDWAKTEAQTIAETAISAGVPKNKILLENSARNSGENVKFTRDLLIANGIDVKKIIAVQKPYAERRAFATLRKQWPKVEVIMSSPQLSYEEYMSTSPIGKNKSIGTMVGDLQRIKLYAEKGFQIPQVIPKDVWTAYEELVKLGYSGSLIK